MTTRHIPSILIILTALLCATATAQVSNDPHTQVSHDAAAHDKSHDLVEQEKNETGVFLRQLFTKYGNNGVMTFEGFEHLLENIGLAVRIVDHDIHDHHTGKGFKDFHPDHNHTDTLKDDHTEHKHGDSQDHEDHSDYNHGESQAHKDHTKDHKDHTNHKHEENTDSKGHEDHTDHDHDGEDHAHTEADHEDHEDHTGHDHEEDHEDHTDHNHEEDHEEDHEDHEEVHKELTETARSLMDESDHANHNHEGHVDHIHTNATVERPAKAKKRRGGRRRQKAPADDTPADGTRKKRAAVIVPPQKCLSPLELLEIYRIPFQKGLTQTDFMHICPSIIYMMDAHMCKNFDDHDDHDHHDHDDHVHLHGNESVTMSKMGIQDIEPKVWGYAVLAVTVISLVGLLSVAVIPMMQKVFYNQLLQFLVALAVGSLTGDALLHLIPHAIVPHEKPGDDHGHDDGAEHTHSTDGVWKGMMVLVGVYVFFVTERLMSMFTDWKRNRAKKCHSKKPCAPAKNKRDLEKTIGTKLSGHEDYYASCQDFIMVHSSKGVKQLAEDCAAHEELKELRVIDEDEEEETSMHDTSGQSHGGGGHGHGHGHSHEVPTSISSIAWMVIMGDGLHNFSDGLAIGASFANGITGGLSTTVAVFCHELPHELGDFAVLLRAGMPARQALFYNIVSSVLCFMGMVIGVLVGNIEQASLWIFALTGGMFIYISLVDMLPELTSVMTRPGESRCCHLLLQILGISVGITIMLLIALFEDKIAINLGDDLL